MSASAVGLLWSEGWKFDDKSLDARNWGDSVLAVVDQVLDSVVEPDVSLSLMMSNAHDDGRQKKKETWKVPVHTPRPPKQVVKSCRLPGFGPEAEVYCVS